MWASDGIDGEAECDAPCDDVPAACRHLPPPPDQDTPWPTRFDPYPPYALLTLPATWLTTPRPLRWLPPARGAGWRQRPSPPCCRRCPTAACSGRAGRPALLFGEAGCLPHTPVQTPPRRRLSFGLQNKVMISITVDLTTDGRTHASYVPIHPTAAAAAVLQNNPVVVVRQPE